MGKTWEALKVAWEIAFSDPIKDELNDCLWTDWAHCINFDFWAWDFIPRHKFWIGIGVGLLCCCWILLWLCSPYKALFPFRWTWHFIMCLHVVLWSLYAVPGGKSIPRDNKDKCKGTGSTRRFPRRIRRLPSGKYGMVQPVIGESAGPI